MPYDVQREAERSAFWNRRMGLACKALIQTRAPSLQILDVHLGKMVVV